jgi:lipopolysaccharide export system protein LptA
MSKRKASDPLLRHRAFLWGSILALALVSAPNPSMGQSLNLNSGKSGVPLEIYATNGVEWQQERKVFIARGNAKAIRGNLTLRAHELVALYREEKGGNTEVYLLKAKGNVRLNSPGQTVTGQKGIYDVDNAILTISGGKRVKFTTATDEITASKQLEYWEKKQMAVARGDAVAVRKGRRLRADTLAAYFRKDKKGRSSVYRVEAFDNVRIRTALDTVIANRGVYNVSSGIATLTGSVKIIRGQNRLNGCRAEVNLNTGISKLFSCPQTPGKNRVRGVLKPIKKK